MVAQILARCVGHVVEYALDPGVHDVLLYRRDDEVGEEDEPRPQALEIRLRRGWTLALASPVQRERDLARAPVILERHGYRFEMPLLLERGLSVARLHKLLSTLHPGRSAQADLAVF